MSCQRGLPLCHDRCSDGPRIKNSPIAAYWSKKSSNGGKRIHGISFVLFSYRERQRPHGCRKNMTGNRNSRRNAMCDVKKGKTTKKEGISKQCPTCQGKGQIQGVCSCNMEWRGTQTGEGWEDCKCQPDQECPTCHGAGTIIV